MSPVRPFRSLAAALRRLTPGPDGLYRCRACGQDFVCVIESERVDAARQRLRLRCGACGVWCNVRALNSDVDDLERRMARDARRMTRALERVDRKRMEAELYAFVTALGQDVLDAGDFTR